MRHRDARQGRFLSAEWRDLAMLNYEVDPAVLAERVPHGCECDAWSGSVVVSIVGFMFLETRVMGIPIPFHGRFEEVNLRFYVRRRFEGAWRRGVVFIKEIVPRRAIAAVARAVYSENYVSFPMRHSIVRPGGADVGRASYEWHRNGAWEGVSLNFSGPATLPPDDSEMTFITEHYRGYARRPDGATVEYEVEHPRWQVFTGSNATLTCDIASLYGPEFVESLSRPPRSAWIADGSPVVVRRGRTLRPPA